MWVRASGVASERDANRTERRKVAICLSISRQIDYCSSATGVPRPQVRAYYDYWYECAHGRRM